MKLFMEHKERDSAGNWRFRITPNPQLVGYHVIRHADGNWTCDCPESQRLPKVWSPVAGAAKPCDHVHHAYVHYIEMAAKQNQMQSKVAEAAQRVRQQPKPIQKPATPTYELEPKRKITLED